MGLKSKKRENFTTLSSKQKLYKRRQCVMGSITEHSTKFYIYGNDMQNQGHSSILMNIQEYVHV
jgi:hypothetical protein